jgi:hypothetical protein
MRVARRPCKFSRRGADNTHGCVRQAHSCDQPSMAYEIASG